MFIWLNIIRLTLLTNFVVTHSLQGDYNNDAISESFIKSVLISNKAHYLYFALLKYQRYVSDNHCGKIYRWISTHTEHDQPVSFKFTLSLTFTQQPKYSHNQWNGVRNGLGTQKTLRNHMSHMKFEETLKKLYVWDIYGGHPGILLFVHLLQGCPPRLCSWISVEIISIGQPFTAGHVCFPKKWWFSSLGKWDIWML